jgi:hypothetical protein
MELPLRVPSPDHVEFDELCSQVEEFEPLPTFTAAPFETERGGDEESSLDPQILAGLVSPY